MRRKRAAGCLAQCMSLQPGPRNTTPIRECVLACRRGEADRIAAPASFAADAEALFGRRRRRRNQPEPADSLAEACKYFNIPPEQCTGPLCPPGQFMHSTLRRCVNSDDYADSGGP